VKHDRHGQASVSAWLLWSALSWLMTEVSWQPLPVCCMCLYGWFDHVLLAQCPPQGLWQLQLVPRAQPVHQVEVIDGWQMYGEWIPNNGFVLPLKIKKFLQPFFLHFFH
jgi:hypothetical protein